MSYSKLLDLIRVIMLCCLGTCCYLLGNKGAHSYNGNPKQNLGDASLSQGTLDMITKRVHESVGYIDITDPLSGTCLTSGTGFRAGDVYFVTAYHVLKDKVGQIVREVCYLMDSKNKTAILETIKSKLDVTGTVIKDPLTAIRELLEEFVHRNATNIAKLIHLLEDTLEKDDMENRLFETWTKNCKVNFISDRQFLVDWKIVFGDEESDIIIVKLIKISDNQQYPKPMILDADYMPQNGVYIIRYNVEGTPHITIDQDTKVYEDDSQLQKDVESAIESWKKLYPDVHGNYFNDLYRSCRISYNEITGRVVLRASKSFKHGASGSPIVYKFNGDGQPIVGMIYQRGFPEFYYEAHRRGSQFYRFKDAKIDPAICLFEGGTSMKHLANLLDKHHRKDLQSNIFSQPSHISETHIVGTQDLRKIQDQLHQLNQNVFEEMAKMREEMKVIKEQVTGKSESTATGLSKMHELAATRSSINSEKLNNMIRQAKARIEYETRWTYIKTKAFKRALEILQSSNIIVITGNPGDGKTTLAIQLLKEITSAHRERTLNPLIIYEPEQFDELVAAKSSLCVLIDNIFGSFEIETSKRSAWINRFGIMYSVFKTEKDIRNNILIMTSRKDILRECSSLVSVNDSPVFDKRKTIDLSWKESMSHKNMRDIFDVYVANGKEELQLTEQEIQDIEFNSPNIGFPQCCKMLKQHADSLLDRRSYFINPKEYLLNEINKMLINREGMHKYCSLLVLLFSPNFINSDEHEHISEGLLTFLTNEYGYSWNGKYYLKQTLRLMDGLYVQCEIKTENISFLHESIQTAIALSFGSSHTKHFIQFSDSRLLSHLALEDKSMSKQDYILIPQSEWQNVMTKVKEQLLTQEEQIFKDIADMQVWKNTLFVKGFLQIQNNKTLSISHLDKRGRSLLVYFALRSRNIPVKIIIDIAVETQCKGLEEQFGLALNSACSVGNEEIVEQLLCKCVKPDIDYFISAVKGRNANIVSKLIDVFQTIIQDKTVTARLIPHAYAASINVLHQACFEGNLEIVKIICSKCPNLALTSDSFGATVLHISCYEGHVDICEYLITNYPDLLNVSFDGILPIHLAAQSGNIKCYNVLEKSANTKDLEKYIRTTVTDSGYNVLHAACLGGGEQMCKHIINKYPHLLQLRESHLKRGEHILHLVAYLGNEELLKWMINEYNKHTTDYTVNVNTLLDNDGSTILHTACRNGNTELCQYIAKTYPALVNVRRNDGCHIFHATASLGSIECLKLITDIVIKDSDPDHRQQFMLQCLDNVGSTILHTACRNGKTELCQYIVETYPALVNVRRNDGIHILHETAWSGSIECLNLITDIVIKDSDPDHRQQFMLQCLENDGSTILHTACYNGKTEQCQYIAKTYPALVNVRRNDGIHILHVTAFSGSIEYLKLITDIVIKDSDPDHRQQFMLQCLDKNGSTILHAACRNGKTELCQYIVETYPALVNVRRNNGMHILHETAWSGSIECLNLITDIVIKDSDPDHRQQFMLQCLENDGSTILHTACYNGKTEQCQYIAKTYPALVNVRRNDGIHILHVTAFSGSIECLKLITDIVIKDSDPDHRQQFMLQCLDKNGSTILHRACCNGKTELCQYIVETYPALVNVRRNNGMHILHETAWSGSIECLNLITDIVIKDSDPDHRQQFMLQCLDNDGSTILHTACYNGKTEQCQYIAKTYPALVNVRRNDGIHILHETAFSSSIECLKLITDIVIKDSDPDHRQQFMLQCLDNDGSTILHASCRNGKTELCQYIVETYPALVNVRRNNGIHILHETAFSGTIECLKLITDIVIKDSDSDHRQQFMLQCLDNDGSTILHASCRNGKTELCQYIAETYPALVNVRRNDGCHILHETACSGSVECMKLITDIVIKDSDPDHRQQFMLQCLDNVGNTILHSACCNGKTELCLYIVETYPALVNVRRNDGIHILHVTAFSGSIECLKLITDIVIKDSDPDHRQQFMLQCLDNDGSTILHTACYNGKTEQCQYIAKTYPALVNVRRNDGCHIFHATAFLGSIECLKLITDIVIKDSDPDHRQQFMLQCLDNVGSTILHISCRNGKTELCQYIVETYPALVNVRRNNGIHILHETAFSGSIECLKLITDIVIKDRDPDHRQQFMLQCLDKNGSTILHTSCRIGKTELCQYIIEKYPALVNVRRNDGLHILHATAWSGSIECLNLITDIVIKDSDPDHRQQFMLQCLDNVGSTILHRACCNGKTDLCQYIVETYPALVNVRRNDGIHILHETAFSGSIECLKLITDIVIKDSNPDHRQQFMLQCLDNDGSTILHASCCNDKTELCQYIVEKYPALVNVRRNDGMHILHVTACSGNIECLKLITDIVIKDSDPDHRQQFMLQCLDNDGSTILHRACCNGKTELCQYIVEKYPALVNVRRNDRLHILHETACSGSVECMKLITDIVIKDNDPDHRQQFMLQCLDNVGNTILHRACCNGKTELCLYIVETYPALVNVRRNDGIHILHETAFSGSIECLKLITDIVIKDSDPDHRQQFMLQCLDNDGSTILHASCCNDKTELCQYIVEKYPALVNVRRNDGMHILHVTACSGNIECLKLITDIVIKDSDPDHRQQFMLQCLDNDGSTILHRACCNGKTELCQYIVEKYPALVNVRRNDRWHILHETACSGSVECMKLITDIVIKDSDPDHRQQFMLQCLDNVGNTILHRACCNGKTELCLYIVETYPALVNVRRNDGSHILHVTAFSGSIECLKLITDIVIKDSDPDHRQQFMLQCLDKNGSTILHTACRNGKTELCQYIVETYPALVNVRRNNGMHILHETAFSGSIECLKLITDIVIKDSNPDHRQQFMLQCLDKNGSTILHTACRNGKTELCQYIVETYPALVNVRRNNGIHILHETAFSGSIECLKLITDIVIKDSDPNHRQQFMLQCLDNVGNTILHRACCNGKTELCLYIVETYPALVNVRRNDGIHILHVTAFSGSIECLKLITDIVIKDSDPDHRQQFMLQCLDKNGSTILHASCRKGRTELCQYIVKTYPALVNVRRNDGIHILHETAFSGSIECLKLITDYVLEDSDIKQRQRFMVKCLSNSGKNILQFARMNKRTDMCRHLEKLYPALVSDERTSIFDIYIS